MKFLITLIEGFVLDFLILLWINKLVPPPSPCGSAGECWDIGFPVTVFVATLATIIFSITIGIYRQKTQTKLPWKYDLIFLLGNLVLILIGLFIHV